MIEMHEPRDSGRKVVPFNTGRVQIGRLYQPRITQSDAQWIERHAPKKSAVARWLLCAFLGLLALSMIAGRV